MKHKDRSPVSTLDRLVFLSQYVRLFMVKMVLLLFYIILGPVKEERLLMTCYATFQYFTAKSCENSAATARVII